jgi:DNA-binding IscR family transcriptional regulator
VHHGACSLRELWNTLEQWMRGTLNQITLADLVQHEGRITELLRSRLASTVFEETVNLIPLGVGK